jgi:UDP-GlcNAc3NAcA epimerase
LAGALAAVKLHIPVAHVEAGLRSFNRKMPEEINRLVADQLSTVRFTPTGTASTNLINEGFPPQSIHQVGDVMFDAVLYYGEQAERNSQITTSVGVEKNAFILATIHRAENTDCPNQLRAIVSGLEAIHKEIPVVWPLHPRTRNALASYGMAPELQLMEPVGYLDMLKLERLAAVVVTDSGGVQKEAFFQRTPCVTIRTETEWVELIECGWNRLSDPQDAGHIVCSIHAALDSNSVTSHKDLYGDGHAAKQIVECLVKLST